MKKFLKILVFVLTVGAIGCLWFFVHKEHVEHPLQRVDLTVERPTQRGFIDKDVEYQNIIAICDTTKNTDITKIPLDSVRRYLATIPWAIYTEAQITFEEVMVVKIVECEPIMRVYNKDGRSVYLDVEGNIFPTKSDYTPHLIIGSGNLNFKDLKNNSASISDKNYINSDLPKIYRVIKSVLNNSYTRVCVKQVYYDKKTYELVLNNVETKVILGNDKNLDERLMNLQYFFEKMQGSPELEEYSVINFNFDNQVVCTKNKRKK